MDRELKSLLDEIQSLLDVNKGILKSIEPERKKLKKEQVEILNLMKSEMEKTSPSSLRKKEIKNKYFANSKKLNDPKYTIIYNEINNRYQKIFELKQKFESHKAFEEGFISGAMDEELKSLKNQTKDLISQKKNKDKILTNDSLWAIADDMRARKEDGEFDTYREAYQWACEKYYKKNVKLTVKSLERAYHKAKSEGRVGEKKTSKVSIPLMITNKMRLQLSTLGYTRDEMRHLTPEQCWKIINKGVPKKPSRERGRNQ